MWPNRDAKSGESRHDVARGAYAARSDGSRHSPIIRGVTLCA
jgi:hypothetical protein